MSKTSWAGTVAYLKISEDEAKRLSYLPTLVTSYTTGALDGTYILPPIKYPDGRFYLKLGHHDAFEGAIETVDDLLDWYRDGVGDREAVNELAAFLKKFINLQKKIRLRNNLKNHSSYIVAFYCRVCSFEMCTPAKKQHANQRDPQHFFFLTLYKSVRVCYTLALLQGV